MNSESGSDPHWTRPFQGKGNEPNVIYSKDLPQKFYSKKIYIYGKRLHVLPVDYDAELIVENGSDTTDQILYTVFLLKTSNIAPNAIDAMLQPTKHNSGSDLDINVLLNSKEAVKTIVYEEPEKRGIVMILLKPIPIQSEFITRTTKPQTSLFTLVPKTYSIANARVGRSEPIQDGQIEGFTGANVTLKKGDDTDANAVSEVKKMEINGLELECTMNHGEDELDVVTRIDTKKKSDSAIFFVVAASFFLVITTIVISPYMYFAMKCSVEKTKIPYIMDNIFDTFFPNVWENAPVKYIAWLIVFIINTPFWLLIFFKRSTATWGNFILSWIFWSIGFSLMADGANNNKTEQTIVGCMLLALLATGMFSINYYSDEMNKPAESSTTA